MTPIAAFVIYTANEHERDVRAAHGPVRRPRPSLAERLRSILAATRPQRPLPGAA
jgi:hypothetical protein